MKSHPVVPNKSSWYKRTRKLPLPFFFGEAEVGIESSFPPVQSTQRERKDFRMYPGGHGFPPLHASFPQARCASEEKKVFLQFLRNLSADFLPPSSVRRIWVCRSSNKHPPAPYPTQIKTP